MLVLDKIKNILNNKKVKVYEVNLALEILNNGIQFPTFIKDNIVLFIWKMINNFW